MQSSWETANCRGPVSRSGRNSWRNRPDSQTAITEPFSPPSVFCPLAQRRRVSPRPSFLSLSRRGISPRARLASCELRIYANAVRFSRSQQQEGNSCSDGQLSGVMPDVAMATASFSALHLIEEQELELDLGDGASHLLPHVSPSGGGTIEPAAHRSSLPHQHQRHFSGPPPPPYVYHRAGTALPRFI